MVSGIWYVLNKYLLNWFNYLIGLITYLICYFFFFLRLFWRDWLSCSYSQDQSEEEITILSCVLDSHRRRKQNGPKGVCLPFILSSQYNSCLCFACYLIKPKFWPWQQASWRTMNKTHHFSVFWFVHL